MHDWSYQCEWADLPLVPHIHVSESPGVNRVSIGSDNRLSPIRRQATIWTSACSLSIGSLGTNFSEFFCQNIKLFIHKNAPYNIVCEMAAILSRGDELNKPQVLCGFVVCMWCAVGVGVRPLQIIYHGVPVLDQNWADYDPVLAHCGIFRRRLFTWHWVCSRCVDVFSHDAL